MAGTRRLLCLLVFAQLVISSKTRNFFVRGQQMVPCYFIFGDSLVDSGNNNKLSTNGKVDYPPYGIDFPEGPTGRFTNGRTFADLYGEYMGFEKFIKPFATAEGSEILKGVNYASGYSGIRDETGKHVGARVVLSKQLQNFRETVSRIADILRSNHSSAEEYLNQCLYLFSAGSNDYINNYFLPKLYDTSRQYSQERYSEILILQFAHMIKDLYKCGARKIALSAIPPIGCTPNATATYDTHGAICVENMNNAAKLFNRRLRSLVDELNHNLTNAKFVYLDAYKLVSDYITSQGRDAAFNPCCPINNYGLCSPRKDPCPTRALTVFYDALHPAESANRFVSTSSFGQLKKIL